MKDRAYFDSITPCGENCTGCKKKQDGICQGCLEADGCVPEWKESGRCRIYSCAKEHGAVFCGVCKEFPCDRVTELLHWKKDPIAELSELADGYREYLRRTK